MARLKNFQHNKIQRSTFKKSLLAIAVLGLSSTAYVEVIEVRGTRGNLINARDLKRNSDTVVDSITALDIGSLPDRSVLEAIQRLPGVSVERFAGADETFLTTFQYLRSDSN